MKNKIDKIIDDMNYRILLLEKTEKRIIDTGIFDEDSTLRLHYIYNQKVIINELIDQIKKRRDEED